MHAPAARTTWRPPRPVSLELQLQPLQRGSGDPTQRRDHRGWWRTAHTPAGPATLHLSGRAGEVDAAAWGSGAEWMVAQVPAQRRFVVRRPDPDDGRAVHLELSSRGRTLIEHLERGRTEHFGKLIARMTPAEREALKTTLRAFVRLSAEHTITKEGPHALVIVRRRA